MNTENPCRRCGGEIEPERVRLFRLCLGCKTAVSRDGETIVPGFAAAIANAPSENPCARCGDLIDQMRHAAGSTDCSSCAQRKADSDRANDRSVTKTCAVCFEVFPEFAPDGSCPGCLSANAGTFVGRISIPVEPSGTACRSCRQPVSQMRDVAGSNDCAGCTRREAASSAAGATATHCSVCERPLLLIRSGRDLCARCQRTTQKEMTK